MSAAASHGNVTFRFYGELNGFLAPARRGGDSIHTVAAHESVKHALESLGVPHTEVALLLLNGTPAQLAQRLRDGDRLSVFPAFRSFELPGAPREDSADAPPRFIADAQLGRLARYLRFAGYDTLHRSPWDDAELVACAQARQRIVLTRDRDLLMHRALERGCHVRDDDPLVQLADLMRRLRLDLRAVRPARCLLCNAALGAVDKAEVAAQLPARTSRCFDEFWRCPDCRRVYWRGSHWRRMQGAIASVASAR